MNRHAVRIVALAVGCFSASACDVASMEICRRLASDEIAQAGCEARVRLRAYPKGQSETVNFLRAYHGEAPSSEVMHVLRDWAIENPDDFIALFSQFSAEERREVTDRLAFAIQDGGKVTEFQRAFSSRKTSEGVSELLNAL